jgi:hypothetical protein
MRRFLVSFALLTVVVSACGVEPPTGTTAQPLTFVNEILGGCCEGTPQGFYLGISPIWVLGHTMQMPPLPYHGAESPYSTFSTRASISSNHADGGRQAITFRTYRPQSTLVNGVMVASPFYVFDVTAQTGVGGGSPPQVTQVASYHVYPGDEVYGVYTKRNAGGTVVLMGNNNASGLGQAFNDSIPYAFTEGTPDPDTIYPFQMQANVSVCTLDMPGGYDPNSYGPGSFRTSTAYGQGPNAPMHTPGPHSPSTAGCSLAQTMDWGTGYVTVSYSNRPGVI